MNLINQYPLGPEALALFGAIAAVGFAMMAAGTLMDALKRRPRRRRRQRR